MTTRPTRPTRFLSVCFDGSDGIRRIKVRVCVDDPESSHTYVESDWHTARATGSFRGEALEDLAISAYAGHDRPVAWEDPRAVWGWGYAFEPSQVKDSRRARLIAATLDAISRSMAKLARTSHEPCSFAEFLRHLAAVLSATSIRVYADGHLGPPLPLDTGPDQVEGIGRAWAGGGSPGEAARRLGPTAPTGLAAGAAAS